MAAAGLSRDEFVALGARPHRRAGVAGGARRPRDAGLGVREAGGRRRGRPRRRSCSSRWSTRSGGAGSRSSAATRRSRWSRAAARSSSTGAPPAGVPTDQGALAALEALLARLPGAARSPSCRRSTAASSATSATTSCARSSACPNVPHRRPRACPTRCCRSPVTSPRSTTSASGSTSSRTCSSTPPVATPPRPTRYDAACARLDARVDELARPLPYVPSPPPASDLAELPTYTSTMPRRRVPRGGRGGSGVHPRRRHLPGGARAALRPRRPLRPVRRVPRAAPGQPVAVHVLRAPPRGDAGRLVARADGAAARRPGDQPSDRRAPAAAAAPRPTTGAWPPSSPSTRRSGPST